MNICSEMQLIDENFKKVFKYGDLYFIVRKIIYVNGKIMKCEGIGRIYFEVQGC